MEIGVLGAGQLGRMLALAAYPLGLRCVFLDPQPDAPAGQLAEQIIAPYDDAAALERLARADVVTYEFESVPEAAARSLAARVPVRPSPEALSVAQDRLHEKNLCQKLGIATAPFAAVADERELDAAIAAIGVPAVLKTRRLGYDGKGQRIIRQTGDAVAAWRALGGVPSILEGFVEFTRELSVLAVRGGDGRIGYYPLIENQHQDGMLRLSLAPAPHASPDLQAEAETMAKKLLDRLDYVGVLALELFETRSGLIANEIAPRVHNSGHFTIEGAVTSQFENHLRAVAGLPLGSTALIGHSAMINLIGSIPDRASVLAVEGAHLHLYGKPARTGRKLGHITICGSDAVTRDAGVARLEAILGERGRV
jgi:5-(carboxyamino)imidazole ribonucleotide synthase